MAKISLSLHFQFVKPMYLRTHRVAISWRRGTPQLSYVIWFINLCIYLQNTNARGG